MHLYGSPIIASSSLSDLLNVFIPGRTSLISFSLKYCNIYALKKPDQVFPNLRFRVASNKRLVSDNANLIF